jgi:hypothetical protein
VVISQRPARPIVQAAVLACVLAAPLIAAAEPIWVAPGERTGTFFPHIVVPAACLKKTGANGTMLALAAVALAVSAWIAYRASKLERGGARSAERPPPFGGWLIMLGLVVFLTPIVLATNVWVVDRYLCSAARWCVLIEGHKPLVGLLIADGILHTLLFGYSLTLLDVWRKKRRSFLWHYPVFVVVSAVFSIIDRVGIELLSTLDDDTGPGLMNPVRWTVVAAVSIAYLRMSRRAAGTFVT